MARLHDAIGRRGGARAEYASEPIPEAELAAIAAESSQAERRADDAERELMEWKKMRFMEDRVGEDFGGIILSCTKYGFFVELDDLFIEGLVPIASLSGVGQRRAVCVSRYGQADCEHARRDGRTRWGSGCMCCWTGSTGSSGGCSLRWFRRRVRRRRRRCGRVRRRRTGGQPGAIGEEAEGVGRQEEGATAG